MIGIPNPLNRIEAVLGTAKVLAISGALIGVTSLAGYVLHQQRVNGAMTVELANVRAGQAIHAESLRQVNEADRAALIETRADNDRLTDRLLAIQALPASVPVDSADSMCSIDCTIPPQWLGD